MPDFAHEVEKELFAARCKFPTPMHGPHEAYGVIMEEVREFETVVFKNGPLDKKAAAEELLHIAAMCQRAAEDLNVFNPEE